jgi:hypothetical protein
MPQVDLLTLIVILFLIGVGLYFLNRAPLDPMIILIMRIVGIVIAIWFVLAFFGVIGKLSAIHG